ncbi:acyl-homoserine-lactone synthase [Mesorhizobium shangrilense]|uniref:Acyl-homoserine-lactone synthase n=1 Tax=Mesorhizobium shangrilense TaxID=460060 RepID=A0ABV2DM32_9HYPH
MLLNGKPLPCHLGMIESSRFYVDTALGCKNAARGIQKATMALFAGVLEWSHANGYSEVATVTDLRFERILGRPGLPFSRLGTPHPMETTTAIVGIIPATMGNVIRVRPKGYEPFFVDRAPLAA